MNIKNILLGNAFIALSVKIVGVLITLVGIRLLLDNIGADGYGKFSVYLSLVMLIASFAQLGIPQILVKNVSRYIHLNQHNLIRGTTFYSYFLTAVAAVFLSLLLFIAFPIVDEVESLDYFLLVMLFLVTILMVTNKIRFSLIRAVGRGSISEIPELIIRPLILYVSIIFIYILTEDIVLASVFALLMSVLLSAIIGQFIYKKVYKNITTQSQKKLQITDWIPQIALGFVAASCLAIREHGAILIASGFLADDEIGIFRVTQQLMRVAILGSMAVNLSQAPKIAKYWLTKNHEKIRMQLLSGFKFASAIPLLIILAGVMIYIVFNISPFALLLGSESNSLESYMLCLIIPSIIYILTGPSTQMLIATNQERLLAVVAVIHSVLYLVVATALMMKFGLEGLIYAHTIINSLMYIVAAAVLFKVTNIQPSIMIFLNEYLTNKK